MYCIIVKRADFQRYDLLHQTFGQKVPIIWERRHADRRVAARPLDVPDRRHTDRRGPPPASWMALGFVVVNTGGL